MLPFDMVTPADIILSDTTQTILYTVPAGKKFHLRQVNINNIHASSDANFSLWINETLKVNARTVPNKLNYAVPYSYVLTEGQTIQVQSSVSSALNIDCLGVLEDAV